MTREAYAALLQAHDWHYGMSDDHKVFLKGDRQREELKNHAENNPEYRAMYIAAAKENRHG